MKIYFPLKVEGMFRHFSLISFSTICANHFPGNMYNSSEERTGLSRKSKSIENETS